MPEKWLLAGEDGQTILPIKSLLKISVKAGGKVVAEAIEKGSFASYNKTTAPLEISAQLGFEGDDADLKDALDKLKKLKDGVCASGRPALFSLVTPAAEYESLALESYDYDLTREDGRGALYVDCKLVEVREVKVAYSAIAPSNATTVNSGNVSTSGTDNKQAAKPKRTSSAREIQNAATPAPGGAKK